MRHIFIYRSINSIQNGHGPYGQVIFMKNDCPCKKDHSLTLPSVDVEYPPDFWIGDFRRGIPDYFESLTHQQTKYLDWQLYTLKQTTPLDIGITCVWVSTTSEPIATDRLASDCQVLTHFNPNVFCTPDCHAVKINPQVLQLLNELNSVVAVSLPTTSPDPVHSSVKEWLNQK